MTASDETQAAARYEALTERLRQLVEQLESGDLPLAEALALYEEGMRLVGECQRLLDQAELRVRQATPGQPELELSDWSEP